MNESRPDYELFKEGIEHLVESKVGMLSRYCQCPVLFVLLIATVASMHFDSHPLLTGFFGVLIVFWGIARYLIWPKEKSKRKKSES